MLKRIAGALALCLLVLLPMLALASEAEEIKFVSPTRDPNAPEYDLKHPEELDDRQIVAHSFILMERSTEHVLRSRNPDTQMFPASTTKILTTLMALYAGDLTDTLTISPRARAIPEDSSTVPFKEGETVTLEDALYGMMLRSGNEAANAVAEYVSEDIDLFVQQMNETARMLGCTHTNFVNPHGYHDEWHQTTARDLALIMNAALENEDFRTIIKSNTWNLSTTNMNPSRKISNTNLHINPENNYYYRYSIGGKTGFTSDAGYVLVEAAEKNGVELIAVVMYSGEYSRWPDTSRLFEYGFSQYKSITPEEIYRLHPTELQINGFALDDPDIGRLTLDIRPVDPSREVRFTDLVPQIDALIENVADYTTYRWNVELRAPITQGQIMGTLTFYPPNEDPVEYELLATRSIAVRLDAPPTLEEIVQRVQEDPSPFPPFSLDWVLPPILGALAGFFVLRAGFRFLRRRRKRKKQLPTPKKRTYS